jgi:hypothetical protein
MLQHLLEHRFIEISDGDRGDIERNFHQFTGDTVMLAGVDDARFKATPIRVCLRRGGLVWLRSSPLFSATWKMAKCSEYRHVVPGHPPLRDLSAFYAEHCPEVELRLAT